MSEQAHPTDTVIAVGWVDRPAPTQSYPWLADLDAAAEREIAKRDAMRLDVARRKAMEADAAPVALVRWGRQELHKSTDPKNGLRPRKRRRLPWKRWLPRISFHGTSGWR